MLILGTIVWLNIDLLLYRLQPVLSLFLKYFTSIRLYHLPAKHFNKQNLLVIIYSGSN